MIPRIHNRGSDFRRACWYILHDQGKASDDRVLWTHTANLGEVAVEDAWRPMYETWRDRTKNKRANHVDLRGRDNKEPVFHFTLSWAPGETPSAEHMKEAALAALKELVLDTRQAVIAAHSDKDHLHVHIIVNTVDRVTGRTADLKYSKSILSSWAEQYEREHGIKCEQRIKNNEERRQQKAAQKARKDRPKPTPAQVLGLETPKPKPKRVRDHSLPRPRLFEKKDVLLRMNRLKTEVNHRHMVERDETYARQRHEREELHRKSEAAMKVVLDYSRGRFKSRWRELYAAQRQETTHLTAIQGNLFERAVYVFWNAERLGGSKPLSFRQKVRLITSPTKLFEAVDRMHGRERSLLSAVQRVETKLRLDRVWAVHEIKAAALKQRHAAERTKQKQLQEITAPSSDYLRARNQLLLERRHGYPVRQAPGHEPETDSQYIARIRDDMRRHYERVVPKHLRNKPRPVTQPAPEPELPPDALLPFNAAAIDAPPVPSRAEEIKRDMENYRNRNPDRDAGKDFEP